ncbi:MAG TPA: cohesin domain-containing protein [Saprospiraceae bacterium]|nr:cohesin domain-containing protein [Saprospiraceae bacterium]HMU03129.1 cohesin domain-containing protein [Saprospiraceae bacterium]
MQSTSVDIKKNDEIEVSISLNSDDDLLAIMLPLSIDNEYLEIDDVQLLNNFQSQYYYSKEFKTLTFLDISSDHISSIDVKNGEIVTIRLKAKKNLKNVFDHIHWENKFRNIELIDMNAEFVDGEVLLELKNIFPSQERMKVINNGSTLEFFSTVDENSNLTISSIDGKIIHLIKVNMSEGINYIELPEINQAGVHIATVYNNGKIISEKYIK